MKKLLLYCLVFLFFNHVFGQRTISVFLDDTLFLKKNNCISMSPNFCDFKDSLPDGLYVLYNVFRKDSSSEKTELLRCNFIKNRKEGLYERTYILSSTCKNICHYSYGKKNGADDTYFIDRRDSSRYIFSSHGEYFNGKKHGLFIKYQVSSGLFDELMVFSNDSIRKITRYGFSRNTNDKFDEIFVINPTYLIYTRFFHDTSFNRIELHIVNGVLTKYLVLFNNETKLLFEEINLNVLFNDPFKLPLALQYITVEEIKSYDEFLKYLIESPFRNVYHDFYGP